MKEIVNWLIGLEERAAKVYESAASAFSDNKELYVFLTSLSEEERSHAEIVQKASYLIKEECEFPSIVYLDDNTKKTIEDYFLICEKELRAGNLSQETILEFLIATEYSEWNNIFIYVINTLKRRHRELIPEAVKIQQHKRRIERFLEKKPEFRPYLDRIKEMPKIWEEKLLVVDDEPSIADVLAAILEDEGIIDTAANGEEALRKLSEKYYAVIVTDVDMPVMNGMEFYKRAVERFPWIGKRFLFFTGSPDQERQSFFEQNSIKFLSKPSQMRYIRKSVIDILER